MAPAAEPGTSPDEVLRNEDLRLLRGAGRFRDDLRLGQLACAFVRSSQANAELRAVDTRAAETSPGVVAVFSAPDLALRPLVAHSSGALDPAFDRPPLAAGRVRFVGEPVAVVVAGTRAEAADAAELVAVTYGPAAPLPDPVAAERPGAPPLFEGHPTNVAHLVEHADPGALDGADVVVEGEFVNQRVAPCPMETNGALATVDDGVLVVWASSQRVHGLRDDLAACLGLDPDRVRVVAPMVGGGFGGKYDTPAEAVVTAAVAWRLGRPVLWSETRPENLFSMAHGRAQRQRAALGLRHDGTVVGLRCELLADAGAYPTLGALVPGLAIRMLPWVYGIPRVDARARSVATTTSTVGAYRGPGRAEVGAMVERLMDMAAARLRVDPVDLRRRNLPAPEAFPFTTVTGMTYDTGDYRRSLDTLVELLGYSGWRAEQGRRRAAAARRVVGVGVAMWLDITPSNRPGEYAAVDLLPSAEGDVEVVVRAGTCDQGQSHETTWALIVRRVLGIDVRRVRLLPADTAAVPFGTGTGSARSLQVAGGSVLRAAQTVLDQARAVAAHLLEVAPEDLVVAPGGLAVAGTPARSLTWGRLAASAASGELPQALLGLLPRHGLGAEADVLQDGPTFPAGSHGAVVEVDLDTGAVDVVRFVAVDDCGRVINPAVVTGQQRGGAAQGIGQALYEEIRYDELANPLATTLADYLVPSAADLPAIEAHRVQTPTPVNALGAKGIGQAGAIGATPAVQNAVVDALAHLGVRHLDLPCTPERVWRAVRAAERG